MHSVKRSTEPERLAQIRRSNAVWDDINRRDRARIRRVLWQDFKGICGYCEKSCEPPTRSANSPDEETIDHFRPRNKFPAMSFDWLNLVYACKRCNDAKAGQWPDPTDQVNQVLKFGYVRFKPVDRYVNPNHQRGQRLAQDYFDYNTNTGEVHPADGVNDQEWSIAFRTIRDVDLNDNRIGENDPRNLRNRRLRHLNMLIKKLEPYDDSAREWLAVDFASPDKLFSSFVAAYVRREFPNSYQRLID